MHKLDYMILPTFQIHINCGLMAVNLARTLQILIHNWVLSRTCLGPNVFNNWHPLLNLNCNLNVKWVPMKLQRVTIVSYIEHIEDNPDTSWYTMVIVIDTSIP